MWMQERQAQEQSNQSQQAQNENEADTSANDISSDSQLHQRLQEHHKKSNERWTKMEEHIAKAWTFVVSSTEVLANQTTFGWRF